MSEFKKEFKYFFDRKFLSVFFTYLLFLVVLLGFSYILLGFDATDKIDGKIQESIFSLRGDALTQVMIYITNFADTIIIFSLSFLIFLYFIFRKKYEFLFGFLTSSVVAALIFYFVKLLFAKARPSSENALIVINGFSFPSGHTMIAVAFYGILAYFVFVSSKNNFEKAAAILISVAIMLLIAFSRVYLGVHWPSDVFASFIFSGIWLGFLIHLLELKRNKKQF